MKKDLTPSIIVEVLFPNKMLKVSNELISSHKVESNAGTIGIGDIYEEGNNHFVFSPLYPLQHLTKYSVVAQNGIKDKYAHPLQASTFIATKVKFCNWLWRKI